MSAARRTLGGAAAAVGIALALLARPEAALAQQEACPVVTGTPLGDPIGCTPTTTSPPTTQAPAPPPSRPPTGAPSTTTSAPPTTTAPTVPVGGSDDAPVLPPLPAAPTTTASLTPPVDQPAPVSGSGTGTGDLASLSAPRERSPWRLPASIAGIVAIVAWCAVAEVRDARLRSAEVEPSPRRRAGASWGPRRVSR